MPLKIQSIILRENLRDLKGHLGVWKNLMKTSLGSTLSRHTPPWVLVKIRMGVFQFADIWSSIAYKIWSKNVVPDTRHNQ